MKPSFRWILPFILLSAGFVFLSLSCKGDAGPAGPAGQSVTILVTPTPSLPTSFLGMWGTNGTNCDQFDRPHGVALDGLGNVYVADTYNNRVQKFTPSGTCVTVWGNPTPGTNPGEFYLPTDVAIGIEGDVWVADAGNNRVQRLDISAGSWVTAGGPGAGGATWGGFNGPNGVGVDNSGNIWAADTNDNRIQVLPEGLDPTVGTNWMQVGQFGTNPGQFRQPMDAAMDGAGNVWVSESMNNRLQELPAGLAANVAANWVTIGGLSSGSNPGQFSLPGGLSADSEGNLYVADTVNQRVQILPAGRAATVSANWAAIGGTLGSDPGEFNYPYGVGAGNTGCLYVADGMNYRIQKFGP